MDCEEAKIKVQALVDNELEEREIPEVLHHIESCYSCRDEYIGLLTLQKKLKGVKFREPEEEWFEKRYKKAGRRAGSMIGQVFFIVSYIALLVFAFASLFRDPEVSLFLKLITGGVCLGIIVLFTVTVGDRIREKKTDRYGDVWK